MRQEIVLAALRLAIKTLISVSIARSQETRRALFAEA
jgi:hypothetical protein